MRKTDVVIDEVNCLSLAFIWNVIAITTLYNDPHSIKSPNYYCIITAKNNCGTIKLTKLDH